MRRIKKTLTSRSVLVAACLVLASAWSWRVAGQGRQAGLARSSGVTVFEGARLITGDGSAPIENSAFIVANNQFTRIGRRGELQIPAGAAHVDLTGKTVMPAKVDLHGHIGFQHVVDGTMRKRGRPYGTTRASSRNSSKSGSTTGPESSRR